jgi:hypothetical protein
MNPTPFQADCSRKAGGLRDYQDRRMRSGVCAECLRLRKFHYGTGCKFRRMKDHEWAEYCGVEFAAPKEKEVYLREVAETKHGGLTGLFYFRLECGHREERFLNGVSPQMPKTLRCAKCAKTKGETKMAFWQNGKDRDHAPNGRPAADALTPAPAHRQTPTTEPATVPAIRGNGSTQELTRLVPNIQHAIAVRDVLVQALKSLMVRDTDFGTIKGTQRDTLLQPGADKLCNLFQIVIRYEFVEKIEDWTGADHGGEPFFYYVIAGRAFKGDVLMGEGAGSCNSWETKYRWRTAERVCPACNLPNIRKSREGGWYCWRKTGGCGQVFNDGDPAIEGQETGRKPNPDVADLPNTILKMAMKRCKLSTTINSTSASEFFTQNVEDFTVSEDGIETGGHQRGTQAAANHVAEEKIRNGNPHGKPVWKNMGEMAKAFQAIREAVGETAWRGELEQFGWKTFQDMRNAIDNRSPNAREKAWACYCQLEAIARKDVA